jgi:hypothetical protein
MEILQRGREDEPVYVNNRGRKIVKDVGTDDSDVLFHFLGCRSEDTYNKRKVFNFDYEV